MEKESITAKETEEEIARLKRLARKTHDVKLRRRYDMIRLFLSKRAKPEIAAILDISLTQVYLIVNLYKESGIEGLGLKRPTGRHRKLTDEQENELCSIITEKLPKEVGLDPYCNWTAPLESTLPPYPPIPEAVGKWSPHQQKNQTGTCCGRYAGNSYISRTPLLRR